MQLFLTIFFALAAWWASTGTILWLLNRSERSIPTVVGFYSVAAVAITLLVIPLRNYTGEAAAFAAFSAGIVLWGWHEVLFLSGVVAGPRRTPCPPGLQPLKRFFVSAETVIHHELAIVAHAALLVVLTWGAANDTVLMTFLLLWVMRISAKMMIFFGAPNIAAHFLPARLSYLGSYFGRRQNPAFAITAIAGIAVLAAFVGMAAVQAEYGSFVWYGLVLLTSLTILALFEHLALILPLGESAMWSWALKNKNTIIEEGMTGKARL